MDFDVAVIGLGAMGSAILYQLSKLGVRCVGIDRHDPPHAMGSSHGDTRITRQAVGEGEDYVPFVKASHAIWRELERETGEPLLTECGTLIVATAGGETWHHGKPAFVERTRLAAERFAIPHEMLDASVLHARYPHLIGLRGDEIGYFEPGGGYVRPEACIAAQITMARRNGAEVRTETIVRSIRPVFGGSEIETDRGTMTAEKVVVAAGAWIPGLLGDGFPPILSVSRQVLHWFEMEDTAPPATDWPVTIWMHGAGEEDYLYSFPSQEGEHTLKVATEQYSVTTDIETMSREVTAGESAVMFDTHVKGRLAGVSPRVAKAASCVYSTTPDRGFVLDHLPTAPGTFVVSACSGHGFKHSAGIGLAVAGAVAGRSADFDLSAFSIARFG
ncbi:N-methyl-L-tryptophan oxidase [Aurantimonas aggregata]|uniref:N-methyl-L-tryptophan oxidase n=1 Tax=Aurantimonas aggregata TaxID=2047720 RepID=A0A6L9MIN0_9HYPH|nr:N-methyl-L-tryptophan oxidase [Aurantimonas aggregata]NDV87657.1 N-methyl-L-tryptophan oxidase [Aurantimonas aggregata]